MRAISALRPLVRPAPLPRAAYARALQARSLSVSAARLNEAKKDGAQEDAAGDKKDDKKKEKEEKKRGFDEDAGPPQSPFKVFLQVFKEEIEKNQGWQQNVKQLSGDVDKLADSKAMKAARDMYERTRVSRDDGLWSTPRGLSSPPQSVFADSSRAELQRPPRRKPGLAPRPPAL